MLLWGAMVVYKWSACLPITPTIRVRIPPKANFFSVKVVFEKNENKQKEDVFGPFFKKLLWQFLKILGYFKFQHLVTLPRRDTFLGNANS